jgi:hypothetical protein
MTFKEVLAQVIDWLQQDTRVSYRALKRQFALGDAFLEDLKYELTEVQQLAVDHGGTVLVWAGNAGAASSERCTSWGALGTTAPPRGWRSMIGTWPSARLCSQLCPAS